VVPQLKVNGETVKTGESMSLGEELELITLVKRAGGRLTTRSYQVIAGSYLSLNVIAGSVSPQKLQDLQSRLAVTKATMETQDPNLIESLTREDLLGDLFYAGTLGYYAQYLALSHIAGLNQRAHHYLAAGIGSIGYEPNVSYLFGQPRSIEAGGVSLDIPILRVVGASDGDTEPQRHYTLQVGLLSSALEHAIPEQMFNDPNDTVTPDAVSAVKALQKANAQGQRIYRITQTNMEAVLGNIHHDNATMAEIQNALHSGREVITHTAAVSVPGWNGAGYIILDSKTGDGAYKISGGKNGGVYNPPYDLLDIVGAGIMLFLGSVLAVPVLNYFLFSLFVGLLVASVTLFLLAAAMYNSGYGPIADAVCSTAVALLLGALLVLLRRPGQISEITVLQFIVGATVEGVSSNAIASGCGALGRT
jgi:hypothetical protein